MTYFSTPPLDERFIEQVFQSSLEALRATREQVFGIAEAARDELNRLLLLLDQVQEETNQCIALVEDLERKTREARSKLAAINRDFASYTETEIREAYAVAERRMVELGAAREREKALRQRRDDLERQVKHVRQVVAKADHVVSQVGIALDFLSGNVDTLAERVQGIKFQAAIASQVIRAQEEERRRVARDIHDGPAQLLANMALRVELLERMAGRDPEQLHRELRGMQDAIKSSLRDLRRVIFNLRPMALDDLGLVPTLRGYLDMMREQFGLETELTVLGRERRLTPTAEIALFRIAQEAVHNAHHHSRCRRVKVRVEFGAQGVHLSVVDDGIGFDPKRLPEKVVDRERGFGLLHMRERARLLQGEFRVMSEPGKGTTVSVRVPWSMAEADASGKGTTDDPRAADGGAAASDGQGELNADVDHGAHRR